MPTPAAPNVHVLFFDGVDDLDPIGPFEVLTAAGLPVRAVRPPEHPETVWTQHGLKLEVAEVLDDSAGLVIVPGGGWVDAGPGVRDLTEGPLPHLLAALHAQGTVLAGVCTGVMLLGSAGVLEGRRAVTNRHALEALAGFGARVEASARVVDDGDIVTCGGPSAGLDLAIHLVARFLGEAAGVQAAARIEYAPVGPVLTAG